MSGFEQAMQRINGMMFGQGPQADTYEDAQTNRAFQQQYLARMATDPANSFGGGVGALLTGVAARRAGNQAGVAEETGRNEANTAFQQILGGGYSAPAATVSTMNTPEPAVGGASEPIHDHPTTMGGGSGGPLASQFDAANMNPGAIAALQRLEAMTGGAFNINSAYRDPEHNVRVGGANRSEHMNGNAFDIDVSGMSEQDRQALIRQARAAGFGGVGVYNNALHFDVGAERNWGPSYRNESTPAWALDALGTPTNAEYQGSPQATMSTQNYTPQQQPDMARAGELANFISNPYAGEGQVALAQLMMQRMMTPDDPMAAIQMQMAQLQLDQARNPQPEPGFEVLMAPEIQELGLAPGAYQRAPDGRITEIGGGGVTVNTGDTGPSIGTIPQGYAAQLDPSDPSGYRLMPIPGGPEDTSAQDELRAGSQISTANLMSEDIGRATEMIAASPTLTTGFFGNMLSGVAGSQAADLSGLLDTIGANISFEALNAMRAQSPTGGALGNVTERELALLQATSGNISQSQSPEQLVYNLERLQTQMDEIVNGPTAPIPPAPPPPPVPQSIIDQGREGEWSQIWADAWQQFTPEEREAYR